MQKERIERKYIFHCRKCRTKREIVVFTEKKIRKYCCGEQMYQAYPRRKSDSNNNSISSS
jgi:hypothetical protein